MSQFLRRCLAGQCLLNTSAYCDNASEAFTGLRVSNDLNILFSTSISMVIGYIRQGIATTTTPWEYPANHGL